MKETYRDVEINIEYDEYPENPRDFDCNVANFALYHNRYSLPCETPIKSTAYSSWSELQKALIKEHDAAFIQPVWMYDHSSLSFHIGYNRPYPFNDQWDSGMVGFAFITREMITNVYGWKRITRKRYAQLLECVQQEINVYQLYASGQVYGYDIPNYDESCYGFFGYDTALESAKYDIDYHLDRKNVI